MCFVPPARRPRESGDQQWACHSRGGLGSSLLSVSIVAWLNCQARALRRSPTDELRSVASGGSAAFATFHAMVWILAWHAVRSMCNCATASRYGSAPELVIASVTNAFRVSDGTTKVPYW